ncbi:hypothetical protein IPV09_10280 [Tessaracoccus sp. SD287]|uniref:Flp pilus assembly protein CpaB n=1 Tax=Tessaracoccus sp. SD287 TaxID=2782008 RepID=UPI001A96511A|nr:RcpC/CpaB family pilus assembly protein [Tessaracoccus sp. SD287]MBO1031718.1 hypothetical protein [Tessaracoccus sp. SD287]
MSKRTVAAIVAVILALISGFLVLSYAGTADVRAMRGQEPTYVVVTTADIPAGTAAKDLKDLLEVIIIPAVGVAPGAMSTIENVLAFGDQVTATDLVAGEQVIANRFTALEQVNTVSVPPGLQEVSLTVQIERAVGGRVKAGSKIGVVISLGAPESDQPKISTMALTNVLVTKMEALDKEGVIQQTPAPTADGEVVTIAGYLVTLALNAPDVEKLVYGLEHGEVWLTLQTEDTKHEGRRIVTQAEVKP